MSGESSSEGTESLVQRILRDLTAHGQDAAPPAGTPDVEVLGFIAVDLGCLQPERLDEALRLQADALRRGEKRLLGAILVEQGWMTAADLERVLAEQRRRRSDLPEMSRFEVREQLGSGATAVVYRAWDRTLQRMVALKVLRDAGALSDVARERFRREARAAASLHHPNIVMLYDTVEADGRLMLVLEVVEGRPLDRLLRDGQLDLKARLCLIEKAARGVAAAHARHIVHRDLKPANVLVGADGEPKVGDFGLAHVLDSSTALTRTGTTLGTPLYMSPEQVEGRTKEVSCATDVYALGAILYEAVTSRPPHQGETIPDLYQRILHEEPIPPRRLNPRVQRDVETVILKALDKAPSRRYADAGGFADDLRRILDGEPITARPISSAARLWRRLVKHRAVVVPTVAAVVLPSALGLWVLIDGARRSERMLRALADAAVFEKAGRPAEARELYRTVLRDLPDNEAARAGLVRAQRDFDTHEREDRERARTQEEALRSMGTAFLEDAQGEVVLVAPDGRRAAATGAVLPSGHALQTGPDPARVSLRYPDSTRLLLAPGTRIRRTAPADPSAPVHEVALEEGLLEILSPDQPGGRAVRIATSHGEVFAAGAHIRVQVRPADVRVEVVRGRARLAVAGAPAVEIAAEHYAEARAGAPAEVRPFQGKSLLLHRLGRRNFLLGCMELAGGADWFRDMRGAGCRWDLIYDVFSDDLSQRPSNQADLVKAFLWRCRAVDAVPLLSTYKIPSTRPAAAGPEASSFVRGRRVCADPELMHRFFDDVEEIFDICGEQGLPAVFLPDWMLSNWAHGERDADGLSWPVAVKSTGRPDLAAFPDTLAGLGQAVAALRDRKAPKVLLAWYLPIPKRGTNDPDRLARLATSSGRWDLAVVSYTYRDAGVAVAQGVPPEEAWWSEADYAHLRKVSAEFHARTGLPLLLFQVPFGNTVKAACNNTPGHYMDNAVQQLLGAAPPSRSLEPWAAAGYAGALFGTSVWNEATLPLDRARDGLNNPPPAPGNAGGRATAADDDGGYLRERTLEYYRAPLPLLRSP